MPPEPKDPELVEDDALVADQTEPMPEGLTSPKNDAVPDDDGSPETHAGEPE